MTTKASPTTGWKKIAGQALDARSIAFRDALLAAIAAYFGFAYRETPAAAARTRPAGSTCSRFRSAC